MDPRTWPTTRIRQSRHSLSRTLPVDHGLRLYCRTCRRSVARQSQKRPVTSVGASNSATNPATAARSASRGMRSLRDGTMVPWSRLPPPSSALRSCAAASPLPSSPPDGRRRHRMAGRPPPRRGAPRPRASAPPRAARPARGSATSSRSAAVLRPLPSSYLVLFRGPHAKE
jgi:hypothetical protein